VRLVELRVCDGVRGGGAASGEGELEREVEGVGGGGGAGLLGLLQEGCSEWDGVGEGQDAAARAVELAATACIVREPAVAVFSRRNQQRQAGELRVDCIVRCKAEY